jgi:TonB family protein
MTRSDITFTAALCASLIAHATLIISGAEWYTHRVGTHIWLPGFERQEFLQALLVPSTPDDVDMTRRLGASDGAGQAISAASGDVPMIARKGFQDQPFLSRDPIGAGAVGNEPAESALPVGEAPKPLALAHPSSPPSSPDSSPKFGPQPPEDFTKGPFAKPATRPAPTEIAMAETTPPAVVQETPTAPTPPSPPANPTPPGIAAPGAQAAADPAPKSDSEIDPISTVGGAEFRPGSTDVQLGRGHKITRPRLSLAGRHDLTTYNLRSVVLRIQTDETGKVIDVDVFRSSGSTDVDQPCKLAAFNWWFEPPKNSAGKPVADVILFSIRFM